MQFKKEEEQFEKEIEAKEQKKTGTTAGDVVDDIKADTRETAATLQEVAATVP